MSDSNVIKLTQPGAFSDSLTARPNEIRPWCSRRLPDPLLGSTFDREAVPICSSGAAGVGSGKGSLELRAV